MRKASWLIFTITLIQLLGACSKGKGDDSGSGDGANGKAPDVVSSQTGGESGEAIDESLLGTWLSGCVASISKLHYQSVQRKISILSNGTFTTKTMAYADADCTDASFSLETTGSFNVYGPYNGEFTGYTITWTRDSFTLLPVDDLEMDHLNGTFTAEPLCEGLLFKLGEAVDLTGHSCKYAGQSYAPFSKETWTDVVKTEGDQLFFAQTSIAELDQLDGDTGTNIPEDRFGFGRDGEFPGTIGWSPTPGPFSIESEIIGTWTMCDQGTLVTLSFQTGGAYMQSAEVGMDENCVESGDYTIEFSGTYEIPGDLDYTAVGYEINFIHANTTIVVHDEFYLDAYINATLSSLLTPFCTDLTFSLETVTSLMGHECKPSPESEGYQMVVGETLYDVFALRDGQYVDSRVSEGYTGTSDADRLHYLDGDLRYTKQ